MPILNYTTTISVSRTVGEIQKILASHGARSILTEYDANRQPASIVFVIPTQFGDRGFRLPANIAGVQRTLERQRVTPRLRTPEQAARVGWRIVKNWVEAQAAIIEAGMVSLDQVMLPYLVATSGGPTLYESLVEQELRLLPERTGEHDAR